MAGSRLARNCVHKVLIASAEPSADPGAPTRFDNSLVSAWEMPDRRWDSPKRRAPPRAVIADLPQGYAIYGACAASAAAVSAKFPSFASGVTPAT